MMTSDDKVCGWVKKGQNHDDVILECPLTITSQQLFELGCLCVFLSVLPVTLVSSEYGH